MIGICNIPFSLRKDKVTDDRKLYSEDMFIRLVGHLCWKELIIILSKIIATDEYSLGKKRNKISTVDLKQ